MSSRKPRSVYFLDRSLGREIVANRLRDAGFDVRVHDDVFPQDAADEIWLRQAGAKRWLVITRDAQIRYHRREQETLLASGVRAFVIVGKNLAGDEMADILIAARSRMEALAIELTEPFIAKVYRDGRVVRWYY